MATYFGAMLDELRQLGWVEGQNLQIEWRFADGNTEVATQDVTELVRMPVDVLLMVAPTPLALQAEQLTQTIPIVVWPVQHPVETGLVSNLARPGRNLTALTQDAPGLPAKRLDLLRQLLPGLTRLAVLQDSTSVAALAVWDEIRTAAEAIGVMAEPIELRSADDAEPAFATAEAHGADAVFNSNQPLVRIDPGFYSGIALDHHIPVVDLNPDFGQAGFLMAYGPNVPAINRRVAVYIDKILKGTNAGDLPVEQPTVFDLAVNAKTASALGLTIPPELASQVTDWIT
jgi:putative ABC transport system substrate-binding protein